MTTARTAAWESISGAMSTGLTATSESISGAMSTGWGIAIDLRGDANRTGRDIGIIKDIHQHLHNPNILASRLQIIKYHNYGKPLFFYLVQLTGGSHPSGGHLLVLDGSITLPGEYCFSTATISSNSVLSLA